ncbi:endolytic transglycosylase MltG [Candidatus Uhrbacteria bacterium]|nr:endolytic transglycosylase MltG [Candidatus Uhrbacteria bacterium]
MKHLGTIFFCVGLLALIFGAVVAGFAANEIYFLRPAENALRVTLTISEGATLKEIARQLADQRLVSSPRLFEWYVRSRDLDRALGQGTFEIMRGTNMRGIANLLTLEGQQEETITIIEGWTRNEIADYLVSFGISRDDFLRASDGLEGYLFPDTYRIFADATADDIVQKMRANFDTKVGTISQADLILASIVEREVALDEDRRMVADIFMRRQNVGWALQADSTVNYVTGKDTPSLSLEDRDLDTPYNTYLYPGLPPGPISNPGLSSIEAVRNPLPNDFWYFLTDAAGNVHYAETLDGHNENKARYLR